MYYDDVRVGDALPELEMPPLAAEDFVRYAAASGDHNPLHTDPEQARAAGFAGVIAHGMLVMGMLGRVATAYAGPNGLRSFATRFRATSKPGDQLRCGGRVTAISENGGRGIVEAELWARDAAGELKASATIVAELPRKEDQ